MTTAKTENILFNSSSVYKTSFFPLNALRLTPPGGRSRTECVTTHFCSPEDERKRIALKCAIWIIDVFVQNENRCYCGDLKAQAAGPKKISDNTRDAQFHLGG